MILGELTRCGGLKNVVEGLIISHIMFGTCYVRWMGGKRTGGGVGGVLELEDRAPPLVPGAPEL